jgi:hypothetical protein
MQRRRIEERGQTAHKGKKRADDKAETVEERQRVEYAITVLQIRHLNI